MKDMVQLPILVSARRRSASATAWSFVILGDARTAGILGLGGESQIAFAFP